jgi:hypothetical protein
MIFSMRYSYTNEINFENRRRQTLWNKLNNIYNIPKSNKSLNVLPTLSLFKFCETMPDSDFYIKR